MDTITWSQLWPVLAISFGITYIVTDSVIGYWARLLWCFFLQWNKFTRYFWPIATCPPCNSFWTGGLVTYITTGNHLLAAQGAIIACGLMGILQSVIGGNIVGAGEDFEQLLKIKRSGDDKES